MSKQWQIRRGTTADNDAFTGAQGEVTMDTDKNQIRLHDGVKQGGYAFGDSVVDFQLPTAENNYTWYRKYRSGWVEQGGRIGTGVSSVTIPVEMSDSDYQAIITWRKTSGNTNTPTFQNIGSLTQTTTDFTVTTAQTMSRNWYIMGMAA